MKNRIVWMTAVFLIGFMGVSPSRAQVNLLDNGGFEDGVMDPWGTYGTVTAEVVDTLVGATVPENPIEGEYCLHLVVPTAGANFWDIGLTHGGHVFEEGKRYTLSAFFKSASGTLQINFKPELAQDPWTAYGEQMMTITEDWVEYSTTTPDFTSDVSPGSITFHIGDAAGEFWVDGVRFYEGDYEPPVLNKPLASEPNPTDGAEDVSIETDICWMAGDGAVTHEIYFGTDPCNLDLVGTQAVGDECFEDIGDPMTPVPDPNLLAGTTYYWQIVEVNDPCEYTGPIWSFTTVSGKATVLFPEDGSVIEGMIWDGNIYTWMDFGAGPTSVSYECFFSDDPQKVIDRDPLVSLGAPPFFPTLRYYAGYQLIAPYTDSLVREETYYWCVDSTDNKGNPLPGDIWEFSIQGYRAFSPDPQDGAVYVATDVLLDWREGLEVTEHDVYLGTDWDDVNDAVYNAISPPPEYLGSVTSPDSSLSITGLLPETTYYWRVDEVYGRPPPPAPGGVYYKGPVWTFSTQNATPGLVGEYYHHDGGTAPADPFRSKVLVRIDPNINFNFDTDPPPGVDADNFAVKWIGQLGVPYSGETYTFTTETDDGVRLWVDGQLIIDQWVDQGPTLWSGSIQLNSVGPYDIRMEYYENAGGAVARLMWESASVPYGVIPSNYLAPTSDEAKAAWTAYGPDPRDRGMVLPDETTMEFDIILNWMSGYHSSTHELYFGTDFDDVNNRTVPKIVVSDPTYTPPTSLEMNQTYYWCVDESNSLGPAPGDWPGDVWSFTPTSTGYVTREWWLNIGDGTAITDLTGNARYPDEPDGSELISTFEGPTGWADNYGSRIHGWLRPKVSGSYTFWLATDDSGQLWLSTDVDPANVQLIAEETGWTDPRIWNSGEEMSSPIALDGRKKYYISGLMKEGGGGDNIAVAWQGPAQPDAPINGDDGAIISGEFLSATPYDPPYATNPSPMDGATDVQDRTPALEWWPGSYARDHRVYFSTDWDDVNDRSISYVTVSDPCYPVTTMLDLGRTYYWAVDEVNSVGGPAPGIWLGRKVWSFTISECLSLENVEDYNDRGELRLVWTDGKASVVWGGVYPYHFVVTGGNSGSNLNVSTEVGMPWNGASSSEPVPPDTFSTQSLVLHYDNDGSTFTPYTYNPSEEKWVYDAPYYSEIEADMAGLEASSNWISEGLESLAMWFVGHPLSDGSYNTGSWPQFTMSARGRDIWGRRDEFFYLAKYPLRQAATVSVKVESMDNTDPWAKAGVMFRENMTPYSKYAGVFVTPTNGVTFQWRDTTNGESQSNTKPSDNTGPLRTPIYVRLERRPTNQFVATYSRTGSTWYDVNEPTSAPENPVIQLGTAEDPCIYIGVGLSSHNADVTCTANFDALTLSVIPTNWVNGNIGTNSAEQLYVAIEDTFGGISVVEHPDPEAAIQTDWQEWNIELTEFGGVNLDSVKKVYLGLGDRAAPVVGGSGAIYIDDLKACPPRCVPLLAQPVGDIALPYDCIVNEKDLMVLGADWLIGDRLITTSAPSDVNLTALYAFENNFNDTSGNLNHLTDPCGTNPGFDTGVVGTYALSLDGLDDHLVVTGVGISGTKPRTIACWAKANSSSIPDWTNVFGFTSDSSTLDAKSFDIEIVGDTGTTTAGYFGLHVYNWENDLMANDQEWHHFAGTYDGTTIRWYGDGIELGSDDQVLDTEDRVHVGKRGDNTNYFPGLVDDARIYSVALSEAEIAYLATDGAATIHIPIVSDADLYQNELPGSQWINLKDYSVLTGNWLDEILWPSP